MANILHLNHDIAGVVSIAAPNSSMDIILEQGSQMLGPVMYTQRPFVWIYERILFGKTASLAAVDALGTTTVPTLIIHGSADNVVSPQGSGIISRQGQIANPNVQFLLLDEDGRNGHNNILRSMESIEYANQLNSELRELADQYDGEIPYEVKREFFRRVDKRLANDVNRELMDRIHQFFLDCIQ